MDTVNCAHQKKKKRLYQALCCGHNFSIWMIKAINVYIYDNSKYSILSHMTQHLVISFMDRATVVKRLPKLISIPHSSSTWSWSSHYNDAY